ncbi:hypothetical protein Hanom_Chr09g00814431 [Helianthus anomalus]
MRCGSGRVSVLGHTRSTKSTGQLSESTRLTRSTQRVDSVNIPTRRLGIL